MPRTKVSKSSKRNREMSCREEKIREFEVGLDAFENRLDIESNEHIKEIQGLLNLLMSRTSKTLLQMSIGDIFDQKLKRLTDWKQNVEESELTAKGSNPNDEGYLTEDSNSLSSSHGLPVVKPLLSQNNQQRGCTPGPLSSARLRRPRRSRSACGSAIKPKPSQSINSIEHSSRSKMRTPMLSRAKALSADRSIKHIKENIGEELKSPPTAFMRWPKPGEMVLSICGSPIVSQVMPDRFANVNIPVKNGVLSLRPKKLDELQSNIIEAIDPETLHQIKTLHANLDLIVNMASKTISK